ncbi:hypothetical protein M758_11G104000 [Ceratodon purpureus]|nr:hypothetical protein M758_11G104000 [Ceratodon purpureus]
MPVTDRQPKKPKRCRIAGSMPSQTELSLAHYQFKISGDRDTELQNASRSSETETLQNSRNRSKRSTPASRSMRSHSPRFIATKAINGIGKARAMAAIGKTLCGEVSTKPRALESKKIRSQSDPPIQQ